MTKQRKLGIDAKDRWVARVSVRARVWLTLTVEVGLGL